MKQAKKAVSKLKNKWAFNYNKCVNCGKAELRHWGHGLCQRCYMRYYHRRRFCKNTLSCRDYKVPQLTDAEKGYIAGLIDGEGCIRIYKAKKPCPDGYKRKDTAILSIANTNLDVLKWIQNKLNCGNIYSKTPRKVHHKIQYVLRIAARKQILRILQVLEPYLKIKKSECKKLYEYAKTHPYAGWENWEY